MKIKLQPLPEPLADAPGGWAFTADQILLELAAKAAGIQIEWTPNYGGAFLTGHPCTVFWRPLTNSGDALDLAVKLGLTVNFYTGNVYGPDYGINRTHTIDRNNIRRAIVRAAAEIGRSSAQKEKS